MFLRAVDHGSSRLCNITQQTTAEMQAASLPGAAHASAGGYGMSFSASCSIHFLLLSDPLPLARSLLHVRLPACLCVCVSYTSENASAGSVVYVHLSTSLMDDVESVARWQTGIGLQLNCKHKHKIWDFHTSH